MSRESSNRDKCQIRLKKYKKPVFSHLLQSITGSSRFQSMTDVSAINFEASQKCDLMDLEINQTEL